MINNPIIYKFFKYFTNHRKKTNRAAVIEILCSFRLVLEGKIGKEILESSRLEFLEKSSANNFVLSDGEDNTSRPMNGGGIADLPLLRALLAICQKFREPSLWGVMDSFVLV